MNCKCGSAAIYRVVVTTPADLPHAHAKVKGDSWVILTCGNCLPFKLWEPVVSATCKG